MLEELPIINDGEDKSSPLKNRIRKNYRHIRKWARRTNTNCFRIYDRDIPEYPFAIDFYNNRFCVHYFRRSKDSDEPEEALYKEVMDALITLFNTKEDNIYWRTRIKREKIEQYEKNSSSKEFFTVMEYGIQFKVNLIDYLDTGLFLDHRETRKLVGSLASGKKVLNLFSYTSSFTVHAILGGAIFAKSVDMSNTYTKWSLDNLLLNNINPKNHPIIREDCMQFLIDETKNNVQYDLIIIDPPTISRSKKMQEMFDIQLDYIFLIEQALKLLAPHGVIFFSTNSRKFKFDYDHFSGCTVFDISKKTHPIDFHDEKIRSLWKIMPKES